MRRKSIYTIIILLVIAVNLIFAVSFAQTSNFEVISKSFKSSASSDVYPGSKRAQLRIDMRYIGSTTIYAVAGCLEDLPSGITPSYGYSLCSPARDLNGSAKVYVKPGDIIYFTFYLDVDKSVTPGTYNVTLVISYRDGDAGATLYNESYTINITISPYPELKFTVVDASWSPGAYPGTIDTALRVTLRNNGESALRNAIVKLKLPSGMEPSELQTQLGYVDVGDQATLQFNDIDIDEYLTPGTYTVTLTINGVAETPDEVTYDASTTILTSVKVDALTSDLYVIKPLAAQWGEARPRPSYPSSRYMPLTITLINDGEYDVTSLKVKVSSSYLRPIKPEDVYSARIYPGGSCSLTLYFDVAEYAPDTFNIRIDLDYWVDLGGGTLVKISSSHSISTFVEEYVGTHSDGIYVVSAGWLNNYNVFPNTDNATYQVIIANRLPFQISGIKATLALPKGFTGNERGKATAYLDGPLASYSTATLLFRISVGNVTSGSYEATLTLDYIAQSGGPGTRRVEQHKVEITVVNDSNAIELISVNWLGSAVEPGTYGVILRVDMRDNYIDSMSGVILELDLPQGFLSALDNTSRVKVASASPELIQAVQQVTPQNIPALISMIRSMATSPSPQQYSRGDTITFLLPLNVLVNSTGTYWASGKISYIDSWGCRREYSIELPMIVLGSTRYIDVELTGSLSVKSRYANMTLTLRNIGSSPAYNVYLTIRPSQNAPILIATPSTIYIDRLDAGSKTSIPVTFAFNPMGYQSVMGATTVINYGVVPLTISISYKDANGYSHSYDTSITVALEPFIDIVVRDLKAEASGGTVEISGTLINYGSATAYRVEVKVYVNGKTSSSFIGDMDPGAQTAFRIDLEDVSEVSDVAKISVGYYNIFNEYDHRELNVSIVKLPPKTEEEAAREAPAPPYGLVIVIVIVVFLILVGLLVYRLYKSHMRKLRGEAAVQ
ncbi:MAG: COG1361 S-layer family protein [Candidatus Nezhaarchaeales archaeon]